MIINPKRGKLRLPLSRPSGMDDEYTRQCLIIHPARSITSDQVLDILEYLAEAWGAPAFIRSDNGSEFIAQIIQDWCHTAGVQTLCMEPGSPWQNGFIESFHSRFRDECLNQEIFFSIAETRVVVEDYRRLYNEERTTNPALDPQWDIFAIP